MGAWGHEPFANDAALDWLASAEDDDSRVPEAFDLACTSPYLETDEGASAVAAAAIVAAAIDGNTAGLPEGAQQLAHRLQVNGPLRARALQAIDAVVSERSELRSPGTKAMDRLGATALCRSTPGSLVNRRDRRQ
jgi:hypothetical protein